MESFSVVVPCFNEDENVGLLYRRICDQMSQLGEFEIIFVDDGSTDQTLEVIKGLAVDDQRVKYLSFSKNFGLEPAFRAGFRYATKRWIIQIDADMQSPPEEIPKLVDEIRRGHDIVFARRRNRQDKLFKRLGSIGQHVIASRVFNIEIPQGASTFRIIDSRIAKRIACSQTTRPYFLAECVAIGAKYECVDVEHHPRVAGKSKFGIRRSFRATADLFIGHSLVPLRLFFYLVVAIGLFYVLLDASLASALSGTLLALGLWLNAGYIARIADGASFQGMYLIRDANFEVDPVDLLYGSSLPEDLAVEANRYRAL